MRQLQISKSPRRRRIAVVTAPAPAAVTAADTRAAEELLERIDLILEVL